jgi:hypothetical protein
MDLATAAISRKKHDVKIFKNIFDFSNNAKRKPFVPKNPIFNQNVQTCQLMRLPQILYKTQIWTFQRYVRGILIKIDMENINKINSAYVNFYR